MNFEEEKFREFSVEQNVSPSTAFPGIALFHQEELEDFPKEVTHICSSKVLFKKPFIHSFQYLESDFLSSNKILVLYI